MVKLFLPRIDSTKKGTYVDWLMSLDGETTWDTALEAVRKEFHEDMSSDLQN